MNPTAQILDYSEDHEFVPDHQDTYYAEEDKMDAREEEKQKLTKGKGLKTAIQQFYKDQCVFLTGGTGFLGKGECACLLLTIQKFLESLRMIVYRSANNLILKVLQKKNYTVTVLEMKIANTYI